MADYTFEVTVEIDGVTIQPAEPDVGIMGPMIEDFDLSSVMMQVVKRPAEGRYSWVGVDLLEGLDKEARQTVIRNIIAAYEGEIEDAIWSDQ